MLVPKFVIKVCRKFLSPSFIVSTFTFFDNSCTYAIVMPHIYLMEHGTDIQFIQKLMGHKDLKTTQIYTHVSDVLLSKVRSPLDYL